MALSTVLRIIFAACITSVAITGANSTSPPTHLPRTNATPADIAPSVAGDSTAQLLLTELGITTFPTDPTTTSTAPEVVIPENAQAQAEGITTASNGSLDIFLSSTEANLPASPQDGGTAAATIVKTPLVNLPPRGTATGMTGVRTAIPYPLPTPVIDMRSIEVTSHTISMCLVEPVGPEGSITYFLVTESLLDGTRTWNSSHDLVNGTTVCVRKQDLTAGVLYSVKVVARDDDFGRSQSALLNITIELPPIEVILDPVLELLGGSATKVTIDWSFKSLTHVEEFIFEYNQTNNYPGGFQQYGPKSLSGTTRNITLMGLFPGATYDLRLQGFSGPRTTTVMRRWIPETEPPSHLRSLGATATTVELTWIFPPHTPGALVRHFQVSYRIIESPERHGGQVVFLWTNDTRIILEGLIPDVKYEVNVSTISISGRPSYPRVVIQETGIAAPKIIMSSATTTSFTLDWELPRGSYHHKVVCSNCPTQVQNLEPGVTRVTFAGLRPGNMYNGSLVALKVRLARSDLTLYRRLTYPEGPSLVQVRMLDRHGERLEVSWPAEICSGCQVDSYTTSLMITKSSRRLYWKHSDCVVGICSVVYDSLEPGQEYHAEVSAVRMNLFSNPPTLSGNIRIPPATPGPITFSSVTHDQISIAWAPSFGVVDKYIIALCQASPPPTADCNTYRIEVNSSITEFTCLELKPNTSYNITLSSKSGGLTSTLRWVVKATTSHFPAVDSRPPKAPGTSEVTPYTFPVTFDTSYFDNSNRAIVYYTVLVAEASAVSHASLPTHGNLSEGLRTRTWAKAIGKETIQRYQIAERYPYEDLISESGKREAYAKKTVIVGEEDCSEEEKDVYCNGPLKHNKIYVYQFRAFTSTGYSDTPFSRHVILPEDNSGVVAGISVVLIILFIIVLVLIGMIMSRKFRGNYGKYMAARSLEPLPVSVMARPSTNRRFSRPVLLTDFCHDFQVMNAHCHYGFSKEYEAVMKVGRKLTTNAAVLAANVSKNRYTNILPFDRTRVMLSPVDDVEGSDYINANYIAGYESPREYIACQGPLPGTVDDMWRMIWEHDVATIIMLTQLIEKATVKCDQYWEEDSAPYLHGDIQVTLSATTEQEHWTTRDFTLERNDATKKVRQFHYMAWPDHGVPDCSTALLTFIRTVRAQIPKNGTPTVVHCSAGVGRTGTFISLDRLMRHMEEFNFVDILSVTCDLRMHRSYMVQTEQQYVFIHKCVLDILEEKGIAPKRLPSISSIDTYDMASTRQGSDASAIIKCVYETEDDATSARERRDVVVYRRTSPDRSEDEDFHKRFSSYSVGSAKRSLIEDSCDSRRPSSPKKANSNGSAKGCPHP
ncbi:tyrosine-protein phosphatase 10D-like [Acanthaster planci]|uniref:protein-tyrosine-phosphatase n=1 Tax=Acanthaster planci TaxID=133434 RepID=A0A8B7ZYK9_ACAPL|nr:tyrosine-protein phosphatase 10D-like [Acanthaster planci]XP_022110490.1 tyrosine-protein phosphatase 10D-like [Acanthaster planci]XP_022110499.1 tyrosine-protein phosphatase 10D-like [Acanthaster planci]